MDCRSTVVTLALVLAALLACDRQSLAGGGPENVAVVVNADSWASLAVANEYIALRRVPERNVVYLAGLSSNLSIDVNVDRPEDPDADGVQHRDGHGEEDEDHKAGHDG